MVSPTMPHQNAFLRLAAGLILAAAAAAPLGAQTAPRALTLDEALRLAEDASEPIAIARAGLTRARGEMLRARSERLPQVFGSASYTRALASEFEGISLGGGPAGDDPMPPCTPFVPQPTLPVEARLDSLERAFRCAQDRNPFAGLELPFGRENTWRWGVSVQQPVFSGGRIQAQNRIADAGRRLAERELASQRAQLALDVTQAYYDVALADRLLAIAGATLEQAETTLAQTRLAHEVGTQPEFELLRAQVTRDNTLPLVIQRRADAALARTRLNLLLNLPADETLTLSTTLGEEAPVPVARFAADEALVGDTTVDVRVTVLQAMDAIRVQENALRIARAQQYPALSVSTQYGRVAYPEGVFAGWDDFRTNWTVAASMTVPLFTGGRMRGDRLVAQAGVQEARARLSLLRDAARLDTRAAQERLAAAEATYRASAGTVEQAQRAYQIAEVRFREGISTQLELADSRILLQQAQANRAVAARDLQIARARTALLPYLPLNGGTPGAAQQPSAQQTPPQAPRQQPTMEAAPTGFPGAGM
jgi:outer membrane protein